MTEGKGAEPDTTEIQIARTEALVFPTMPRLVARPL